MKNIANKIEMKDLDTGKLHPFEKSGSIYKCTCGCGSTLTTKEVCDILIHGKYLYDNKTEHPVKNKRSENNTLSGWNDIIKEMGK